MPNRYVLRIDEQVLRELSLSAEAGAFATLGGGATLEYDGPLIPAESGAFTTSGAAATLDYSAGVPADALFVSPWSTGTGFSDAAVRDTDRTVPWTFTKLDELARQVVTTASTGLTWPPGMTNCLEITCRADQSRATGVRCVDEWPAPGVGDSIFWRFYYADVTPNSYITGGGDDHVHPFDDGKTGINRAFQVYNNSDGTWDVRWQAFDPAFGTQQNSYAPGDRTTNGRVRGSIQMQNGVVYRFEYQLKRISTTHYRPFARVYEVTAGGETLLADETEWHILEAGQTFSMADEARDFELVGGVEAVREQNLGSNGWDTDPSSDFIASYWGGSILTTDDWPGPFNSAEESW